MRTDAQRRQSDPAWGIPEVPGSTGEPVPLPTFPGLVVSSAAQPGTVLRDPAARAKSWPDTRDRLAAAEDPAYNRWRADAAVCA